MPSVPIRMEPVQKLLREHGPMHVFDIAGHLDWSVDLARRTLSSTRYARPGAIFRIVRYVQGTEHSARRVAIYAAQAGPDVPKPAIDKHAMQLHWQAEYRKRNRGVLNAQRRLRRAKDAGRPVVQNPFMQLAHHDVRCFMSAAANTSTLERAA